MSDPRNHRLVRRVEGENIAYSCGCVNEIHVSTGALRRVSTCQAHRGQQRLPESLGRAYYEELHAIQGGIPQSKRYIKELEAAIGRFSRARSRDGLALEIGCGVSMYCPALLRAGYLYVGLEPSPWAAECTRTMYDVPVLETTFEDYEEGNGFYSLILSAHSLEHMEDAPGAIEKCSRLLGRGGELWIVIPDDSDPLNPDHIWMFNVDNLSECLGCAGFVVERVAVLQIVKHERFMYFRATKG